MTRRAEDLLTEALQLADAERGELAARLLDSLESPSDTPADPLSESKIKDRLEDVRSGRVVPVPWDEARRQIMDDADGAAG